MSSGSMLDARRGGTGTEHKAGPLHQAALPDFLQGIRSPHGVCVRMHTATLLGASHLCPLGS